MTAVEALAAMLAMADRNKKEAISFEDQAVIREARAALEEVYRAAEVYRTTEWHGTTEQQRATLKAKAEQCNNPNWCGIACGCT